MATTTTDREITSHLVRLAISELTDQGWTMYGHDFSGVDLAAERRALCHELQDHYRYGVTSPEAVASIILQHREITQEMARRAA